MNPGPNPGPAAIIELLSIAINKKSPCINGLLIYKKLQRTKTKNK